GGMDQDINTLIHEFGHAVDWMLFDKVSETQIFNEIYQKEHMNLVIPKTIQRDHFRSNPHEFFAAVFSYMFSPN
ncbi:hypothetical protein CN345_28540, partial [Bacillus thuringiensis]|uniref:anthrax toxin lethal factor-related metalloendopeptidase n=1 Tax=Bacillus thuringiensis TaxID=1428 RepID=UPI000BFAFD00